MSGGGIKTESVPNCSVCGGEGKRLYEGLRDRLYQVEGTWSFSKCIVCGAVWLNPRPILQDVPKCYPNAYFTHEALDAPSLGSSYIKKLMRLMAFASCFNYKHLRPQNWYEQFVGKFSMTLPWIRAKVTMGLGAMLLPYLEGGRLLDIGCGNGFYLALMRELGWEVAGVEMDRGAAEIAESRFGVPVHIGTLEDAPFHEESFDVVTMSHVLEHVPDSMHFIRMAASFLRPGGQMVIVTPNVKSLGHLCLKKDWYALDPPRHLYLFTPLALKSCLQKTGFFVDMKISSVARKGHKIFRKFILLRRTGRFRDEIETALSSYSWVRTATQLFQILEESGNPFFHWGEEIECTATKV